MHKRFADQLREALIEACPYDTGQLRASIQEAQPYGQDGWIITIGNGTTMTRKVPSNVYAAATNNARQLRVFAKGKRNNPSVPNYKLINNPNYHWATNAIKEFFNVHAYNLVVSVSDSEEYDNE